MYNSVHIIMHKDSIKAISPSTSKLKKPTVIIKKKIIKRKSIIIKDTIKIIDSTYVK